MARQSRRFSIYDVMEEKGVFEANAANSYAVDNDRQTLYKGPVKYPMMMYHPKGEERIIVPGSKELINGTYELVGRQTELIWKLAKDLGEEKALRALGWHDHPAKAISASGRVAPPVSSEARVNELEAKIAEMQAELDRANEGREATVASQTIGKVSGTAKSAGLA